MRGRIQRKTKDCRGERREDERKEKESTGIKIKKKDRVGIDGGEERGLIKLVLGMRAVGP